MRPSPDGYTLRGLGADQTLVLINGKRRHASALLNINGSAGLGTQAVDINFIPASAIGQIEVLRDGAAAQYGSDAIAGVINFQLNNTGRGARFGDARIEDFSLFANIGIPLDDQVDFYAFGGHGERRGNSASFYRIASDVRNAPAIYPDGFRPQISSLSEHWSITGGIRGELGGWNFDLSAQYGQNSITYQVVNSLNASLGAASPTKFKAGDLAYTQWVNNLDVNRHIEGPFARTTLAFGLEYRRESFHARPGEPVSFRFGGVRVNQNNPRNTSTAGAATGSQVSTGFRAPGVAQQFFAAAATNNVAGVLVDAVTLPVGNPVAQAVGSSPLKSVTVVKWSVGAVFNPVARLCAGELRVLTGLGS